MAKKQKDEEQAEKAQNTQKRKAAKNHGGSSGKVHAPPYLTVFAILAIVTVIEIYISGWDIGKSNQIMLLMILATGKAMLVALYYMHLRYESRVLRWIAVIPVVFGVGLAYVIMVV